MKFEILSLCMMLYLFIIILSPSVLGATTSLITESKILSKSVITEETKNQYLDLEDKHKYDLVDGQLKTSCSNCDLKFKICNIDGEINLGLDLFTDNYKTISEVISDINYYWEYDTTDKNGSVYTTQQPYTVIQFNDMIEKTPFGNCEKFGMKFTLQNEPIDIIPIVNGIKYPEYAWFYPQMTTSTGGIYIPFHDYYYDEYSLLAWTRFYFEGYNIGLNGPIYLNLTRKATRNGSLLNNVVGNSPYVNDTALYKYGSVFNTPDDTRLFNDKFTNNNISLYLNGNEDFISNVWIKNTVSSGTDRMIVDFADGSGNGFSNPYSRLIIKIDTTGRAYCFARSKTNTQFEMSGTSLVDDNALHMISCIYNATSNIFGVYVDGILENSVSASAIEMLYDGGDTIGYNFGTNLDSYTQDFTGYISEFLFMKGETTSEDLYNLYHISDISSLVTTPNDLISFSLTQNQELQTQFNFTDAINNITYYDNTPFGNITNNGLFLFSTGTLGDYNIIVNGTDLYGNWESDSFTIKVIQGVIINSPCSNVNISHTDNFNCSPSASVDGSVPITWAINDSRVNITGSNDTAFIYDYPTVSDYNEPSCWDLLVTAESSPSEDTFSFVYCIRDLAPTLYNYNFTEEVLDNIDANIQYSTNDDDGDVMSVTVSWFVNDLFISSEVEYNLTNNSTSIFTFPSSNYVAGQVIKASLQVSDTARTNTYNSSTSVVSSSSGGGDVDLQPIEDAINNFGDKSIDFAVYIFMGLIIIGLLLLCIYSRIGILKPITIITMFIYSIMFGQQYHPLFGFILLLISCAFSIILYYI